MNPDISPFHPPASTGLRGWQPPEPESLALLLPQYEITALIGRGGMGAVYRGRQKTLDRVVAIKLLPTELAADREFAARFQREARTLAKLQHPGIVAIYESGETSEGHLYFVMEFIEGTDLYQIIHGPGLDVRRTLTLIARICEALDYAHQQGVIHRDIKPSNILVTADGRAKLADFGLARPADREAPPLTQGQQVMGTGDYLAPEQWQGQSDHRSDLYAMGVMLYEMLTGEPPRGTWTPPSQRTTVDERVDSVVVKALHRQPDQRYQQASEMRIDVERILHRQGKRQRLHPRRPALLLAVAALLTASLWMGLHSSFETQEAAKPTASVTPPKIDYTVARTSAERILALGGAVTIRTDKGVSHSIKPGEVLPDVPFGLYGVRFDLHKGTRPRVKAEDLLLILKAAEIEVLVLVSIQPMLNDEVMRAVGGLRHLREFVTSVTTIRDEWLRPLAQCADLERLMIPRSEITDTGLASLNGLEHVKEMDLGGSEVTGRGIAQLTSAKHLTRLNLGDHYRNVSADVQAVIGVCHSLETLHILGQLTPSGLHGVETLKQLRSLSFGTTRLTADCLTVLADASHPQQMCMIACTLAPSDWQAFTKLKHLTSVRFITSKWDAEATEALRQMPWINVIELWDRAGVFAPALQTALPNRNVIKGPH